jgi:hypothetical protein
MTMRIHKIVTHFRADEAHTLIEFMDQLREVLIDTYGDEITVMLREASQHECDSLDERIDVEGGVT